MRRISFNMTQDAVLALQKTVTRRLGWRNAKVGERLLAVDRLRVKNATILGIVAVVHVNESPLNLITADDVRQEGYPGQSPASFVAKFCKAMKCQPGQIVTRIEFRYPCRYCDGSLTPADTWLRLTDGSLAHTACNDDALASGAYV